jgi:hypothetical protein
MNIATAISGIIIGVLLTGMVVGFCIIQGEINQLKALAPTPTPQPTPLRHEPQVTPPPKHPGAKYVVYEWYLKAEYINNTTWLIRKSQKESYTMVPTFVFKEARSWKQNYDAYLANFKAYPHSDGGPFSSLALGQDAFVSAEFNEATGYTKATYRYLENYYGPYGYWVEFIFLEPQYIDGTWTKTYI